MTYQVVRKPSAEQELAAVWLASGDRNAVTAAAAWLERELARDPFDVGESRASGVQRVVYRGPVAAAFEIIADDQRVLVLSVTSTS